MIPTSLNFGTVLTGNSRTLVLTITNAGKHTKKVQAPTITLESETTGSQSPFEVKQTTCSQTLVAGAHCTVSVTFKPMVATPFTGTLTIDDNVLGDLQNTVALKGTGKAPKIKK